MIDLNNRMTNLVGFFICHELLVAGFYFQFVEGLDPCPLCIFQRWAFLAVGITFLLAAFTGGRALWKKIANVAGFVFSCVGLGIAGRHVYLQYLPKESRPACGPSLDYMMELFSFGDVLKKVMTGSGECGDVSWTFLGLSMPTWALLWFAGFAILFALRFFTAPADEKPF